MRKLALALCFAAAPALADDAPEGGVTNPEEMTWRTFVSRAERGEADMVLCSMGYLLTKSGDHESARTVFEACADAGYTQAMTWLSQLDNNGLGGDYDPDSSANWDRRAAEAGDPVGMFNYGVDLIRGHGVAQSDDDGRTWVDKAAAEGLPVARRLQAADYDLDEVTPDADNWKYAPIF